MGNKYYAPGPDRKTRVDDLFATIAPRYDLINDLQSLGLHRRWKERMIRLGGLRPGESALDVCCGTGDLALGLAETGVTVTGIDCSGPMLEVAGQRDRRGLVKWVRGDAGRLPFADEIFDVVTVGYGLRNLPDWRQGLQEMHRVAKPGGRLLVLDFGKPSNRVWRSCYFAYLRTVVPLFGKIFCGDAATHSYIYESLRHYPAQTGVAAAMREIGCGDVEVIDLIGGVMSIQRGTKKRRTPADGARP